MLKGDAAPQQVSVEPTQVAAMRSFVLREWDDYMATEGTTLVSQLYSPDERTSLGSRASRDLNVLKGQGYNMPG